MGVYVFRSLHAPAIKVGHYARQNAWSRVAHRGFYSCLRPAALARQAGADDLELLAWFPTLQKRDERRLHRALAPFALVGEWFSPAAWDALCAMPLPPNEAASCSKAAALATRRRL